ALTAAAGRLESDAFAGDAHGIEAPRLIALQIGAAVQLHLRPRQSLGHAGQAKIIERALPVRTIVAVARTSGELEMAATGEHHPGNGREAREGGQVEDELAFAVARRWCVGAGELRRGRVSPGIEALDSQPAIGLQAEFGRD